MVPLCWFKDSLKHQELFKAPKHAGIHLFCSSHDKSKFVCASTIETWEVAQPRSDCVKFDTVNRKIHLKFLSHLKRVPRKYWEK